MKGKVRIVKLFINLLIGNQNLPKTLTRNRTCLLDIEFVETHLYAPSSANDARVIMMELVSSAGIWIL